ncbi:non-POU domain-containing octamer-binding protein-like isoform X2 [Lineus longissimus]|uniref:non-POU domain-containing octamer-binding protein-like isoform X2 n=1 Tax=Lineus longissimus TaxID=88925 RepID=UPI00315C6AE0
MTAGGDEKSEQNKGQTQETTPIKTEGNERPERKDVGLDRERGDRNQRGGPRGRGRFDGGRGGPRGRGRARGGYHEGRGGFQPKPHLHHHNHRDQHHPMMQMGDDEMMQRGRRGGLEQRDSPNPGEEDKPREEKKFTGRCRLFVGNIQDMEEEDFKKMFEAFGEISEVYLNKGRGFGFIRLDTRHNAEAAKDALDGTTRKGRTLRVRFATHGAALKVRHLAPSVSNELLEEAFSKFGQVERAIVIVDDRGRSTGEGIVEFARKPGAQKALQAVTDGCFLLTSHPRPCIVEQLEQKDEDDGLPEKYIQRNAQYYKDRETPFRFAQPGSFEFKFAQRWKQLYEMEVKEMVRLKKEMEDAVEKLESEMTNAMHDHHANQLREELRRIEEMKEMEERKRQEMTLRRQQEQQRMREEDEMRRQEMMRAQQEEEVMHRQRMQDGRFGGGMNRREEMMMMKGRQGEGGMRGEMNRDMAARDLGGREMGNRGEMGQREMGGRGEMGRRELSRDRDNGREGGRAGAPPMQPPPAPPAGMGLEEANRQEPMGGIAGAGRGNNIGGASNIAGGPQLRQSRFDQPPTTFGNNGGMGGNMNAGMFGGNRDMQMRDRLMERRPAREDFHEMKKPRRY